MGILAPRGFVAAVLGKARGGEIRLRGPRLAPRQRRAPAPPANPRRQAATWRGRPPEAPALRAQPRHLRRATETDRVRPRLISLPDHEKWGLGKVIKLSYSKTKK